MLTDRKGERSRRKMFKNRRREGRNRGRKEKNNEEAVKKGGKEELWERLGLTKGECREIQDGGMDEKRDN